MPSSEDVVVSIKGKTQRGRKWAEFIAKELARALSNLEAFEVIKQGDFDTPNTASERAHRMDLLRIACRDDLTIYVRTK